jgi:hypothetical protein
MDKSGLLFAFLALRPWCLLLKVLPNYRFTRLVRVMLAA